MAQKHIPGLALTLVDGNVVWQQGFGSTGSDGRPPVTVDTIFSVQSMSNAFTATAVMQVVQSARLDLDVPITTYLPTRLHIGASGDRVGLCRNNRANWS